MWPWSRIRELERENAGLLADAQRWYGMASANADMARLLAGQLADLKRDGFNPPSLVVPPGEYVPTDDTPPAVLNALRQRLPEGTREWRVELEHARKRLADGEDADVVAKAVLAGNRTFNPFG